MSVHEAYTVISMHITGESFIVATLLDLLE